MKKEFTLTIMNIFFSVFKNTSILKLTNLKKNILVKCKLKRNLKKNFNKLNSGAKINCKIIVKKDI